MDPLMHIPMMPMQMQAELEQQPVLLAAANVFVPGWTSPMCGPIGAPLGNFTMVPSRATAHGQLTVVDAMIAGEEGVMGLSTGGGGHPPAAKRVKSEKAAAKAAAADGSGGATTPRRAQNAYILFCNDMRPKLAAENPSKRMRELTRMMGEQWREMPEASRAEYRNRYVQDRAERAAAAFAPGSAELGLEGAPASEKEARAKRAAEARRLSRERARISNAAGGAEVDGPGSSSRKAKRSGGHPGAGAQSSVSAYDLEQLELRLGEAHAAQLLAIDGALAEARSVLHRLQAGGAVQGEQMQAEPMLMATPMLMAALLPHSTAAGGAPTAHMPF